MYLLYCIMKTVHFNEDNREVISQLAAFRQSYVARAILNVWQEWWWLWGGLGGTIAAAVTFCCLFCSIEQEVRKVAIWWVFISRWLPEWLNVSWRWSCRQLSGRAGPEAWGLLPGCSSSPLKEGQQSNESCSPPNLQLVLCQLYCFSLHFSVCS